VVILVVEQVELVLEELLVHEVVEVVVLVVELVLAVELVVEDEVVVVVTEEAVLSYNQYNILSISLKAKVT